MNTKKTTRALIVALSLQLVTLNTHAWCNRPEQSGAEPDSTEFEIPAVAPTTQPFRFEDPDPARLLRRLEYTIDPTAKSVFLVVVSEQLSPQQATDVQAGILGLIGSSMCQPHDVLVVWSSNVRRVATIRNDERIVDCSPKWLKFRVHQNQADLARLNQYFQEMKAADHQRTGSWDLPHLTHHLGQEFHEWSDYPNRVLILFGSAQRVSTDRSVPSFEAAYPTVGTLRSELSPLSTRTKAWNLGKTVTHFVYTDELRSRVLRDGIQNWISAFFLSQGSPLLTFSADPQVSERVLSPQLPVIPAYVDDVNPGFISVEPVRIFDEFAGSRLPATLQRGSLELGLKFAAELDLDLHVGLVGQGERLSFRNPQTSFGSLRKDFETGWEVVTLDQEITPADTELWVNWFSGEAPQGAQAELRIVYAGTLVSFPITFARATEGNEGRVGSPAHWQQINLQTVLSGN